jgi:hypothetical protein
LPAGVAASIAACTPPSSTTTGAPQAQDASTVVIVSAAASAQAEPPAPPEVLDAVSALRPYAVVHAKAGRRVLYTWTTREQIEELAQGRPLLSREASPTHGPAHYDEVVGGRAAGGDRLAALLRGPAFRRARFAWPAPWATLLGWEGETYGEELVQVILKPEAWIAKLTASKQGWEIVDLDDRPVALDEALRHPERIAAVYFVQDLYRSASAGTYGTWGTAAARALARPAYREYVLCNEPMIASWGAGTEAIARELEAGAAAVDALRRHVEAHPAREPLDGWIRRIVAATWPGPALPATPEGLYEAALAFPNVRYYPAPSELAALARRLRGIARRRAETGAMPLERR